jgi:Predicted nucleic-acid-binding protein containing a Zn-ribbon
MSHHAGYSEWLNALASDEGFYLQCPDGHGSLPPRRVCPVCGATSLVETPLSQPGTVETYSVIHVASPEFADDTPYVTAIVSFGPVRLTGILAGISPENISIGLEVEATVEPTETTDDRTVGFQPV